MPEVQQHKNLTTDLWRTGNIYFKNHICLDIYPKESCATFTTVFVQPSYPNLQHGQCWKHLLELFMQTSLTAKVRQFNMKTAMVWSVAYGLHLVF